MNYLFDRRVQWAILVGLLILVAAGIRTNPANMSQNLIAEAAGIVVGVLLTVTLVERMLERRRRERWEEVRSQVFRAIATHISSIAREYIIYLCSGSRYLEKVMDGRGWATVEAADAMAAALEEIRHVNYIAGLQELFKETEWDFGRLRDVVTPRLIEFGEEPKLIQLLMDVDDRRADWKDDLVTEQRVSASLELAFHAATDTLKALIELYRYLAAG